MSSSISMPALEPWPPLPLPAWRETYHNLHMWTQIVGKVRLALTPRTNHWWNVPLYISARGLTTSPMPYRSGVFEIQFDFIDHALFIDCSNGSRKILALEPQTVADFYSEFMSALRSLGIEISIFAKPVEVPDPVPFADDRLYRAYDADAVRRFWQILTACDRVFKQFRARFVGKCSPVHFFWGSFDLAVTRFSGRRAPERPDADAITREAYSHEVISAGWWPGEGIDGPAFYAYAAPEPPGFAQARIRPEPAFYHPDLKEFIFRYDAMRAAPRPEQALLDFLQTTYDAGADLGRWDRDALDVHQPAA